MARQYVTVARAQQNKYLANVSTSILENRIKAASELVYRYCDNDFTVNTYTDVLDGNGLDWIQLRQVHITSLTSCSIVSGNTTDTIDTSDLSYDPGTGRVGFAEGNSASTNIFYKGFQNVTIVYGAGEDPIPEDVQEATVQIVYALSENNDSEQSPAITEEQMGEYKWKRGGTGQSTAIPQTAKDLLLGHVRFEV